MKRIRYTFNPKSGLMESTRVFSGNGWVTARYSPTLLKFDVQIVDNEVVIMEGKAASKSELLKRLKTSLVSIGVVFDDEVRKTLVNEFNK